MYSAPDPVFGQNRILIPRQDIHLYATITFWIAEF